MVLFRPLLDADKRAVGQAAAGSEDQFQSIAVLLDRPSAAARVVLEVRGLDVELVGREPGDPGAGRGHPAGVTQAVVEIRGVAGGLAVESAQPQLELLGRGGRDVQRTGDVELVPAVGARVTAVGAVEIVDVPPVAAVVLPGAVAGVERANALPRLEYAVLLDRQYPDRAVTLDYRVAVHGGEGTVRDAAVHDQRAVAHQRVARVGVGRGDMHVAMVGTAVDNNRSCACYHAVEAYVSIEQSWCDRQSRHVCDSPIDREIHFRLKSGVLIELQRAMQPGFGILNTHPEHDTSRPRTLGHVNLNVVGQVIRSLRMIDTERGIGIGIGG